MPAMAAPFKTVRPVALIVSALVAGAAGLVLFCFDPRQYHFYPVCFFHQTTGLLCPGCGALRAGHQLLHGHLVSALCENLFQRSQIQPPHFVWIV